MSLRRRIQNLEAAQSQTLLACSACGGYDPSRHNGVVITLHDRPLKHCAACGAALTEEGTPLPANYKRIILTQVRRRMIHEPAATLQCVASADGS